MNACVRQFMKKYQNIIDENTINQIVQDVNKGIPGEEAINKVRTKITKAYNNNPTTMKQVKDIQKTIDSSNEKPFTQIRNRLVPEPGRGNAYNNVETTQRNLMDAVLYKHHDLVNKLRNKLFGNRPAKDLLSRMVKVMFKEIQDPEAAQAIKDFNTINDEMYNLYQQSGGLEKKVPIQLQNNPERILGDDLQTFVENVSPLVRNSEDDLKTLYNKALLGEDIEDLILDFTGSSSYLQYAGQYGTDLWSSFINKLQKQSTATAFNKVLGPNSKASLNKLIKDNQLSLDEQRAIENLVNTLNGTLNIPATNGKLTKFSKGSRSLATASMLGGATLTAVSDLATVLVTANFNGLPAIKTMMKGLQGLYKAEENEKLLAQLGFISNEVINGLRNASRYDPHQAGTDTLSTGTDKVLRASGLMKWTDNLKNAWTLSHLGHLASLPEKYGSIPLVTRKQFQKYGITKEDWKEIYSVTIGNDFVDVTKLNNDLNFKVRRMIKEESDYAILEPGALNQSWMTLGTQAGTVKGETMRHITQFKSFLLAGVLTHLSRIYKLNEVKDQAEYTVKLAMAGLTIGMLVNGLKDIKEGNDPSTRDYTDPKNYMEAMTVSGVFGPLGDLMFKEMKYGESALDVASLASSPVVSQIGKGTGAIKKFLDEDKPFYESAGDLARFTGQQIPGRNIWFTQWLTDEIGRDLLLLVNPDYQKKFDKIDRARNARDAKQGLEEFEFFQ
jgi:hypothetical protein